jgi:hypothetical protein
MAIVIRHVRETGRWRGGISVPDSARYGHASPAERLYIITSLTGQEIDATRASTQRGGRITIGRL